MFEVGKKYNSRLTDKLFECVYAQDGQAVLLSSAGLSVWWNYDSEDFVEHKEPIKYVQYFNIYAGGVGFPSASRGEADLLDKRVASPYPRIGVKRVEFTEGEWDA